MRCPVSLSRILSAAAVGGVLIAGSAIGVPVKSPDSGKQVAVEAKAAPAAKQLKPQTTCPVMGGEINKSVYVDVNGKRIYACCPGCLDSIKKDPEKYIKKLEKMGQGVETIPAKETAAAAGPTGVQAKDTAAAPKKCPVMSDSSAKKCPMMSDTSKVKGCYTCPMHPEVMQKGPGKCPKCGMDLVFKKCEMGKNGECKMKKQ